MMKTKKKSNQHDRQPQRDITPPSDVAPPSSHRESMLPLVDVGSRKFEELCRDVVDVEFDFIVRKSLKRTSGVEQYGVDVEGFTSSGYPEVVVSAKCYRKIEAWEFRVWIEDFTKHLSGHWNGKKVKHFVLAVTVEANDDDMNDAVTKLIADLKAMGIQFQLWDRFKITDLLLRRARLIDRYFNRYWRDALSADIEAATPSITGASNRGLAGMGPGLQFIAEKMEGLYLDPLNDAYRKELDAAVADLRRGVRDPLRKWLQNWRANPDVWKGLEPGTKSEGLRASAMVALGDGDIELCSSLLDEADVFKEPPDRTARAFLISMTSGTKAALAELQRPSGRKELELYAALELTDGRPGDAFATLAPLLGDDVSSEVLRLRAIAKFRLGDKNAALNLAKSAVEKSPAFAMPRLALGALRIGAVIADGTNLPFVGMPNPISRSLLLFGKDVSHHLSEAVREFDRLMENVDGDLRRDAEVWKLAALLLNPATRAQGRDYSRSLMARVDPDPVVVAWCLSFGLPIKRGRIRKLFSDRLRNGGGDESHVTVLALLSGDNPKRALEVLNRFAPMFPDAEPYFAHWRQQFGDIPEAGSHPNIAAFNIAAEKGDLQPLMMFMMSDLATPEALMSGAEFLASRGADQEINTIRDRVLGLKTSRAVQIAAGAALNTNDPDASLKILRDAAEAGLEMTGIFVEMRLQARRALGHHHDLIEDLEALIRENDDWKLREQLINAHLRIGALERVKEEAERAFEAGLLADRSAVQLAYALRNVAPEFARKMIEQTDWSKLPSEMSGGLLALSTELGIAALQDDMIRRIVANPDGNDILKGFDSVEEIVDEINKMSQAYRDQLEAWKHGRMPAALAMSGHPKDFVKLFLAEPDCRTSDIGGTIPMFTAGSGLLETVPKVSDGSKRDLKIDLGALMLGERLGIIDLLQEDFSVWIAESLPTALDELGGLFGTVNERIVMTVQAIERSESAVRAVTAAPVNSMDIIIFDDPEDLVVKNAFTEILRRAYQAGHLSAELFGDVAARYGIEDPETPRPLSAEAIVVSRGALADLTLLGVVEQVARAFPIRILNSEITILRRQLVLARDGERMGRQLVELRQKVSLKLESGEWRTVINHAHEDARIAEKPAPLRCLLEIFPKVPDAETLVWMEDRMLSRVTAANVVTVVPLISELVRNDRLSVKDEVRMRGKLRAWGYTFLPILVEELAANLKRAPIVGGRLVDNDELVTLRRWYAADVLMLRYTDQNSAIDQGQVVGEARRFHELLNLKDDLLHLIWRDPAMTSEARSAQSSWVWSNLRLPYLPDPPGVTTPEGRRILVAINAAKAMAMPLHALLNQEVLSAEALREYLEWLSAEAIDDLIEGDPDAADEAFDHVASMLVRILEKDIDVKSGLADLLQRRMRVLVQNYLSLLPDQILERVIAKRGIGEEFPINREVSLNVTNDISIPVRALENGLALALSNSGMKATVVAPKGRNRGKIDIVIASDDRGKLTVDLKSGRKRFAVAEATIAVVHPDKATRNVLMSKLSYRDCLEQPLTTEVVASIADEDDVEVRVARYTSVIDQDFKHWLSQLDQRIALRSEVGIEDFKLPEPDILLKYLDLPPDFTGTSADLATSGSLVEKIGLVEAVARFSSLPIELAADTMALYAEHLSRASESLDEADPASLAFTKILAFASRSTSVGPISENLVLEWTQQLRVFKQILRHAVWETLRSASWQSLPPETMFGLVWLFADQVARVVSPVARQPKNLDRWFADRIPRKLIDYHRFRSMPQWIQHVLLKSTSTRILASFSAKLIAVGAEVPDQLKTAIGKIENGVFTPQPDAAAARVASPRTFWLIDDAVPAFIQAGWMKQEDTFARRDAADILRVILDEDAADDPAFYAPMVAVLLPLDAVSDVKLLERLAARVLATVENVQISESDPAFQAFLEVAAEVHAKTGDLKQFEKIISTLAASFRARWPYDQVRLDDSESGQAALKLLNAGYMYGSIGHDRALVDRMRDVAAIMVAVVEVWPGARLAVLSVLDDLGSQLDAYTASQSIWPTALELRAM